MAISNGSAELETLETEGLGEFELEGEGELETEGEQEFLGALGRIAGDLLGGLGEGEGEGEYEYEWEQGAHEIGHEGEFGAIGSFLSRALPVFQSVARVAVPAISAAIGGGAGGDDGELEVGGMHEMELEAEFEHELEGPMAQHEVMAELLAATAAGAHSEGEAEALIGAATATVISPADRAVLRRILPHMIRGTAILTRILRRRRATRPAVRLVPTIVKRASRVLARRAAAGQPVTRRAASRAVAAQVRRVLTNPRVCGRAMRRNVRATRGMARRPVPRRSTRPVRG
jgi:hypothetical protein